MDILKYFEQLNIFYGDGCYSKVKYDPTLKIESNVIQILIHKKADDFILNMYRQLTQHYTKLPHLFGPSFKIHKFDITL